MSDSMVTLFINAAAVPLGAALISGVLWLFRRYLPESRLKNVLIAPSIAAGWAAGCIAVTFLAYIAFTI